MKNPKLLLAAGAALVGLVVVSKQVQSSGDAPGASPPPTGPPPINVDPVEPSTQPTSEPTRVGGAQSFTVTIQ